MLHAILLEPMDCLYLYNQARLDEKEYENRTRQLSKTGYSAELQQIVKSML
jgi:hypothetical protein